MHFKLGQYLDLVRVSAGDRERDRQERERALPGASSKYRDTPPPPEENPESLFFYRKWNLYRDDTRIYMFAGVIYIGHFHRWLRVNIADATHSDGTSISLGTMTFHHVPTQS